LQSEFGSLVKELETIGAEAIEVRLNGRLRAL